MGIAEKRLSQRGEVSTGLALFGDRIRSCIVGIYIYRRRCLTAAGMASQPQGKQGAQGAISSFAHAHSSLQTFQATSIPALSGEGKASGIEKYTSGLIRCPSWLARRPIILLSFVFIKRVWKMQNG